MNSSPPQAFEGTSRRQFLHTSGQALAGAALAQAIAVRSYAATDETIKIALVGCGGRGTGAAANALQTAGPTKLWAMADFFADRLQGSYQTLHQAHSQKMDVTPERRFVGLDGYRKAIELLGKSDLVILATPPAFRPIHFECAVNRGCNVFMEKSFAVDAPGVRRVMRAGELAQQKNLKVAGGLMWHHDKPREEVVRRIHDGAIGDIVLMRTYRMHGVVGYRPKPPEMSELAHQISNYNNFTWLNGSFFVDWLIHNLDVCCWAKNALPVAAQGLGGRLSRTEPDQLLDQYMVEYQFADGSRFFAQGRHINHCYSIFSDFAHGTKGSALIMENLAAPNPRIYKNQAQVKENEIWRYSGPPCDPYQVEFDLLMDAIRQDKPYNEADRSAKAAMVAIMGRMAVESGQMITWEEALASTVELAPGLEQYHMDSPPPVLPDPAGRYPLPVPGQTRVL